jgi:hypothetical protein
VTAHTSTRRPPSAGNPRRGPSHRRPRRPARPVEGYCPSAGPVIGAEQAVATLKSWRLLRKLRCSTNRITSLVQAVLPPSSDSSKRGWKRLRVSFRLHRRDRFRLRAIRCVALLAIVAALQPSTTLAAQGIPPADPTVRSISDYYPPSSILSQESSEESGTELEFITLDDSSTSAARSCSAKNSHRPPPSARSPEAVGNCVSTSRKKRSTSQRWNVSLPGIR